MAVRCRLAQLSNRAVLARYVILIAVLSCFLAAAPAKATPITISNSSFEDDALSDGGFTADTAVSWSSLSGGWGVFNSLDSNFTGTSGLPGTLPGTATGTHYAYAQGGGSFNQILSDSLAANTQYTLTVAIGNNIATTDGLVRFSLYANAVELAGLTVDASALVSSDTFEDFSVTYTTGNSVTVAPLEVRFTQISGNQNAVDNVRLDAAPVPEPNSLALLLIGGVGVCLARRMRSV